MTVTFLDVDRYGDPDLVTGVVGDPSGRTATAPYHVLRNDGGGAFRSFDQALPDGTTGNGSDVEPGDLDGDGLIDRFLASRGGTNRLLFAVPPWSR